MKDELNKNNLKNGNYIMNLQNHNEGGSHWVAFKITPTYIIYCDSFGVYPPEIEWNLFLDSGKEILVNTKPYQPVKSNKCGWYAIYFLLCLSNINKQNTIKKFEQFVSQFDYKNPDKNEFVKKFLITSLK